MLQLAGSVQLKVVGLKVGCCATAGKGASEARARIKATARTVGPLNFRRTLRVPRL